MAVRQADQLAQREAPPAAESPPQPVQLRRPWIDVLTDGISGATYRHRWLGRFLLLAPATLWIGLFVLIPCLMIVYFSLWRSEVYVMVPDTTLDNYRGILTDPVYWKIALWTLQVTAIVLAGTILIGYPFALFVSRGIQSPRLRMVILLLAIVPFWTSYLVRMVTWLPMLGRNGVLNNTLAGLGILDEPSDIFLYNPLPMYFVMTFLYVVFVIGPVSFMMQRIDEEVIWAAYTLGASRFRAFREVILPLTLPGLVAGALFVAVMVLGEFATEVVVGGGQNPMFAGDIWRHMQLLQWPQASAVSVILVAITLAVVFGLTRFVDIRKEL